MSALPGASGSISLAVAMLCTLTAILLYAGGTGRMLRYACIATILSTLAIALASVLLVAFIFTDRFDIAYVVSYSSKDLEPLYKLSVFWAGQQGSFLLWVLAHAVVGLYLCLRKRLTPVGMAIYLVIQALLLVFVWTKNPFTPQDMPVEDGVGLNPMLMDPWMAVHPPIVFIGYAVMAVPLAYSLAALLSDRTDRDWLEPARKWALVGWAFLGAGIFVGGYWAYKVLGWGGFWGWDPVENSSLVPWLIMAAYIHLLHVAKIRASDISLVHVASIFAFSLVLYAAFLTRSGILGDFSVHSFSGESVGMTIAIVNAAVLLGGLLILTVKSSKLPQGRLYPAYQSREFVVLLGCMVLAFVAAVIFLGMSMPLLTQISGTPAAVDTSFYVRMTLPLAICLMLSLTAASLYRYGKENLKLPWIRLAVFFLLGLAGAVAVGVRSALPIVLAGVSIMGAAASLISWKHRIMGLGGMIAHVGLGLSLFAIVLSESGGQSVSQQLAVDEPTEILGHAVTYKGQSFADDGLSKEYVYDVDGKEVRALTKLRETGADAAREPAIDRTLTGDIYIAPNPPEETDFVELTLKRGRTELDDDFAYRFDDMDIEPLPDGTMLVTATISITDGDKVEQAEPTLTASMSGGRSQAVPIFDGKKRIRLTGAKTAQEQVRLEVLPSLDTISQLPVTATISMKPFIWVLWLGTVLVCLGGFVAVRK